MQADSALFNVALLAALGALHDHAVLVYGIIGAVNGVIIALNADIVPNPEVRVRVGCARAGLIDANDRIGIGSTVGIIGLPPPPDIGDPVTVGDARVVGPIEEGAEVLLIPGIVDGKAIDVGIADDSRVVIGPYARDDHRM